MGDTFTGAYEAAANARLRSRQLAQERWKDEQDMLLRQAAERRAQDQYDRDTFMGPLAGLAKSPYAGVAATDMGDLMGVFQERRAGALGPGEEGPPINYQALDDREKQDRQNIENKVRQLFDTRFIGPSRERGDASRDVAETNARAKVEAERIRAGAQGQRTATTAGDKERAGLDKEWRATNDKFSPYLNRSATAMGLSGTLLARMNEAKSLPDSVGGQLTPQESEELWTAIARNISTGGSGGQVALQLVHELNPTTAYMDTARLLQYVSGIPKDARAQEWTKRAMQILDRQDSVARQNIREGISSAVKTHRKAFIAGGAEARDALAHYGFTPEELDQLLTMPSGAPSGRPARAVFVVPQGGYKDPETGHVIDGGTEVELDPDEIPQYEALGWKRKTVALPGR